MLKQIAQKLPLDSQKKMIERGLNRILRSEAIPYIARVILFGSGARGELTEISDIDVCVVVKDGFDLKLVKSLLVRAPREEDDEVVYDVLVFSNASFLTKVQIGGVCQIAEEEGVILYSAQ